MNRYNITGQDGRTFQVDSLTPPAMQPEWGQNPTVTVTDVTAEYAAFDQKKADARAALVSLKGLKGKASFTAAELQLIAKALVDLFA